MKKIIKKSFLLGLGAATLTKIRAEKIVKDLVKNNAVTVNEGRTMMKSMKRVVKIQGSKAKKIAQEEIRKLTGKLGVASNVRIKSIKRRLESIEKELSSRGKASLKKILKELSK